MERIDRDVGGSGKRCFQVYLGGVRLGKDRDLVAHVGGGKAGVIHRAAGGPDSSAVIVHIGILGNFADDQGIKLAHTFSSFRIFSSASTKD